MTEQPPAYTEIPAANQPAATPPKLEHLLSALNRLKSDISGVEARHPGFGNELSSLCDTVIADLNNFNSPHSAYLQNEHDHQDTSPDEQPDMPAVIPVIKRESNPIVSAIDKAGSGLITGLDKTGDVIILILGKLFAERPPQAKTGTPAKADL